MNGTEYRKIPAWQHAYNDLTQWFCGGNAREGEFLPPERELAVMLGTSRVSVRKVLDKLEEEGWISRKTNSRPKLCAIKQQQFSSFEEPDTAKLRVGVLINSMSDLYAIQVINALFNEAARNGISLKSEYVSDFYSDSLCKIQMLKQAGCSALIIPWVPRMEYQNVARFINDSPLPVSVPILLSAVGGRESDSGTSNLSGTDRMIKAACDYYQYIGFSRIALLGPDSPGEQIMDRHLMAYTLYTAQKKLPNICAFSQVDSGSMDEIAEEWKLYRGDLAVISYDDEHAIRFMTAMHKIGLGAPNDFAIIGCNNIPQCISCDPPLSSFSVDYSDLASKLLIMAIKYTDNSYSDMPAKSCPALVIRHSCSGSRISEEKIKDVLAVHDIEVRKETLATPEQHAG